LHIANADTDGYSYSDGYRNRDCHSDGHVYSGR
jgi:hypothetical protein